MRLRLPQKLVYWAPTGATVEGRQSLASPVQYACRWEDKVQEIISKDEQEVHATAVVYLAHSLVVGGVVMLGTLAEAQDSDFPEDPRDSDRVHEILTIGSIPSLKASQTLCMATLV